MEVFIAYMEDFGFYIVNSLGEIVSATIFHDEDAVAEYCDKCGYNISEP